MNPDSAMEQPNAIIGEIGWIIDSSPTPGCLITSSELTAFGVEGRRPK
jgi:hypothetical protein